MVNQHLAIFHTGDYPPPHWHFFLYLPPWPCLTFQVRVQTCFYHVFFREDRLRSGRAAAVSFLSSPVLLALSVYRAVVPLGNFVSFWSHLGRSCSKYLCKDG